VLHLYIHVCINKEKMNELFFSAAETDG
jgi:hypothetical protein